MSTFFNLMFALALGIFMALAFWTIVCVVIKCGYKIANLIFYGNFKGERR